MKINKRVPFYSNTPDNTHCFQAVLKMVMKYFWPEEDYSWEELEKITAKVEGLWTWPQAGLLWLQKKGVEIKCIINFDYKKFIQEGEDYLFEYCGDEVAEAQIEHSDIEQEQRICKEFIKKIDVEKRVPTIDDIKNLLGEGYLIKCNVNSRKLKRKEGYAGHAILIKGFDDKHLFIHNPGLPPQENIPVQFSLFEEAWAYPNDNAKNIIALRLM